MAKEKTLLTEDSDIKHKLDVFLQSGKLQDLFKDREKLAVVRLSQYGRGLVLPYDDAISFIKTLHKAEEVESSYSGKLSFPDKAELLDVSFKVIDAMAFNRAKVANFLGIDRDSLETYLNGSSHEEEVPF